MTVLMGSKPASPSSIFSSTSIHRLRLFRTRQGVLHAIAAVHDARDVLPRHFYMPTAAAVEGSLPVTSRLSYSAQDRAAAPSSALTKSDSSPLPFLPDEPEPVELDPPPSEPLELTSPAPPT